MSDGAPPGWYPDGNGGQEWWNGRQWTGEVRGGGSPTVYAPTPGYTAGPPRTAAPAYAPQVEPQKKGSPGWLIVAILGAFVAIGLVATLAFIFLPGAMSDADDEPGGESTEAATDETTETTETDEPEVDPPEETVEAYYVAAYYGEYETVCELTESSAREDVFDEVGADDCADYEDLIHAEYGQNWDDGAANCERTYVAGCDLYEEVGDYQDYLDHARDELRLDMEFGDIDISDDGESADVEVTRCEPDYRGDSDYVIEWAEGIPDYVEGTVELVYEDDGWRVTSRDAELPTW